jgi:hypothetical protein
MVLKASSAGAGRCPPILNRARFFAESPVWRPVDFFAFRRASRIEREGLDQRLSTVTTRGLQSPYRLGEAVRDLCLRTAQAEALAQEHFTDPFIVHYFLRSAINQDFPAMNNVGAIDN